MILDPAENCSALTEDRGAVGAHSALCGRRGAAE
jgi:hypothetical protein